MKVKIADITVGKRIRQEPGDLAPLMESMNRHGLFNPVTLDAGNSLLAGFRRLEAAKALGWEEIECNRIAAKSKLERLLIEAEENMTRREFSTEELQQFQNLRRYLSAKGLTRFRLWIKHIIRKIRAWFASRFPSS